MANWYKKAYRGNIPRNESLDDKLKDEGFIPKSDTNPFTYAPIFGDETRGKGYPDDTSVIEKDENRPRLFEEETLINTDTPVGEGAGGGDTLERFTDPVDKLNSFDKNLDPIGPHNMPHGQSDVFEDVRRRSKLRNLNKV